MLREPNRKDAHKAHLPGPLTQLVQSATLTKWKSQVQVLQGPLANWCNEHKNLPEKMVPWRGN